MLSHVWLGPTVGEHIHLHIRCRAPCDRKSTGSGFFARIATRMGELLGPDQSSVAPLALRGELRTPTHLQACPEFDRIAHELSVAGTPVCDERDPRLNRDTEG